MDKYLSHNEREVKDFIQRGLYNDHSVRSGLLASCRTTELSNFKEHKNLIKQHRVWPSPWLSVWP